MLTHVAVGPDLAGEYRVIYQAPGAGVKTVACSGLRNKPDADAEAVRLNAIQLRLERRIRADAQARGVAGVYPGLAD